jgi:hypothetical protein
MAQLVYNKAYIKDKYPSDLEVFFDYFIKLEKPESAVLVLPTNKFVKAARKIFCKKYFATNNKPIPILHFYRLQDFARKCLNEIIPEKKYKLLSDAAILSLMEDAVRLEKLSYFKKENNKISTNVLQKIAQIIIGLKEDGITPESMESELTQKQNIASADLRFEEITKIYLKYNELLADKYLDEPTIYTKIIESVTRHPELVSGTPILSGDAETSSA